MTDYTNALKAIKNHPERCREIVKETVKIYAQHTTLKGTVYPDQDYIGDDVIELDRESARMWSEMKPSDSNRLFRMKAGINALEHFKYLAQLDDEYNEIERRKRAEANGLLY